MRHAQTGLLKQTQKNQTAESGLIRAQGIEAV
jgi:hypothetical protein